MFYNTLQIKIDKVLFVSITLWILRKIKKLYKFLNFKLAFDQTGYPLIYIKDTTLMRNTVF